MGGRKGDVLLNVKHFCYYCDNKALIRQQCHLFLEQKAFLLLKKRQFIALWDFNKKFKWWEQYSLPCLCVHGQGKWEAIAPNTILYGQK